jgi:hypothetical protein
VDGGDNDTADCRSHISLVTFWLVSAKSKLLSLTYVRRGCRHSIPMDKGMTRIHWKGNVWEIRTLGLLIEVTRALPVPYRFSEENLSGSHLIHNAVHLAPTDIVLLYVQPIVIYAPKQYYDQDGGPVLCSFWFVVALSLLLWDNLICR